MMLLLDKHCTDRYLHAVVCLREGERGTCLGHPCFGPPLGVLRA